MSSLAMDLWANCEICFFVNIAALHIFDFTDVIGSLLFGHIARMNESTDASRILFEPPSEVWRKPRGRPRNSGLLLTTWQTPTLGFRKQERMLRTGSTGGCLRSIAQRTRSCAGSYWMDRHGPISLRGSEPSLPEKYLHTAQNTHLT